MNSYYTSSFKPFNRLFSSNIKKGIKCSRWSKTNNDFLPYDFKYFKPGNKIINYDLSKYLGLVEFKQVETNKSRIQCFCLSDLHADTEKNQIWIYDNCNVSDTDKIFSIIIVPGDIGSEIDQIEKVFKILSSRYDLVCYVPGNHEAWKRGVTSAKEFTKNYNETNNPGNREANDSIEKLKLILDLARSYNISVGPVRINKKDSDEGLVIFPLYSWYHSGWDTEPDLTHPDYLAVEKAIPFNKKWGDFSLCGWPPELISSENFVSTAIDNTSLAEAFGWLNEEFLYESDFGSPLINSSDKVISFSHFLPLQELCPEKRFILEPLLSRVIGSVPLFEQVLRLRPHLHLFGHTHIPIDLTINNIRYIQWPLGYHRESERQCRIVFSSGPLIVYDTIESLNNNYIPNDLPSEHAIWTEYYKTHIRQPNIVNEISPWLQKRLDSFSGFTR